MTPNKCAPLPAPAQPPAPFGQGQEVSLVVERHEKPAQTRQTPGTIADAGSLLCFIFARHLPGMADQPRVA